MQRNQADERRTRGECRGAASTGPEVARATTGTAHGIAKDCAAKKRLQIDWRWHAGERLRGVLDYTQTPRRGPRGFCGAFCTTCITTVKKRRAGREKILLRPEKIAQKNEASHLCGSGSKNTSIRVHNVWQASENCARCVAPSLHSAKI